MRRVSISLFAIIFVLFLTRCEPDYPPSMYDEDDFGGPYPVITEIKPPRTDTVFAAVDTITIIGENFIPDSTFVYFDGSKAEILNITNDSIDVISPNIQGDSVKVQVSVLGSYPFGEYPYRLIYAASWYAGIDQSVDIYGMACDNEENLYVSSGALNKILKITPDGEQIDYVTETEGFFVSMKMGPENNLYTARTIFISKVPPGGGSCEVVASTPGRPISDIDFGPNGNLFIAAKQYIYCLKQDASSVEEKYKYSDVTLKAIRVFENYVYVGGYYTGFDTTAVQKGIWRHEIEDGVDGNLGEAELVFDWGSYFGRIGPDINAITFSESGNMYVAASSGNALFIIEPSGQGDYMTSTPKPVYERVLKSPYISLCWGSKNYLYANQKGSKDEDKRLIRIILRENGAPYYGRQQ